MSFLHVTLLAMGAAAVSVPVLLHLLMRQRPRTIVFPAVRFLVSRRKSNQRRLRLQHWSLLAARMLIILLLAAALARPRVPTAQVGTWTVLGVLLVVWMVAASVAVASWLRPTAGWIRTTLTALAGLLTVALLGTTAALAARGTAAIAWGTRQAPVAAALVVDTSPRMQYRHQNQTRLQRAQQLANWVVEQLPRESAVAIVDGQTGAGPLALDPVSARSAIDSLIITPEPVPLTTLAADALQVLQQSELAVHELYVFTDLSAAAWEVGRDTLLEQLKEFPQVNVHIIDVGVAEPTDLAVDQVQVSLDRIAEGSDLQVEGVIRYLGSGGSCQVECLVERPDPSLPVVRDGKLILPELERRGRQGLQFAGPSTQTVRFQLGGFPPGTYHGIVRVVGQDGLAANDQGYFTFEVSDRRRIAVVAAPSAHDQFLISALDPADSSAGNSSPFACRRLSIQQLDDADLASFDAVALLDPPPLPDDTWRSLGRAVEQGMGLAVFLGRNASPVDRFHTQAANEVLPGRVLRQWRSPEGVTLAVSAESHPVTGLLQELSTTVPWGQFPVYRHWTWEGGSTPGAGATTILRFSNRQPALVERQKGRGTVVLMTTPVSDPANRNDAWNRLPTGFDPWPFVVLMDQLFVYLTQGGMPRLNYLTAEPVDFPAWSEGTDRRYQLFTPDGQWQELVAADGQLSIRGADRPGIYRLRSLRPSEPHRGFAVNWPAQATALERLEPESLEPLLALQNTRLVKEQHEIERGVSEARMGIDVFAFFAVVAALLLALEGFLANWFYPRQQPHGLPVAPRTAA